MIAPQQPVDWNRVWDGNRPVVRAVDSRVRLRWCLGLFVALLLVVLARAVQLEVAYGEAFRQEAARPITQRESLPGTRGRILARDGTVLAEDKPVQAVAVRYRYLESPPDPQWLRSMAQARLLRGQRADPRRLATEERRVRLECRDLADRLAGLCGVAPADWSRRTAEIQARVEWIVRSVRQRREQAHHERRPRRRGLAAWLEEWLGPADGPAERDDTIREELDYHVVVDEVSLEVVAEIEGHPDRYPGVRIVDHSRRDYPGKTLAAGVLGYVGTIHDKEVAAAPEGEYAADDLVGRMGLERQYERLLRGRRGQRVETINRSGRVLSSELVRPPTTGRDLILTLDVPLQREAETLLDEALVRRAILGCKPKEAGGALVVMDVRTGAILAAASAPRFDPNAFCSGGQGVQDVLDDPAKPLFDRGWRMAIPPGSVFKVVTAAALLESGTVEPQTAFDCRGYFKSPDALRCEIFTLTGHGHGRIALADALGQSCNVYFFHHAAAMGPGPLVDWAGRLGFGSPTGVDLPDEAAGRVPSPETTRSPGGRRWQTVDTQMLAVGQGELLVTPLQVVRLMAAVANGGRLVTPHVVSHLGLPEHRSSADTSQVARADDAAAADETLAVPPPRAVAGLHPATLEAIREGLQRTVASIEGTAYATVYLDTVGVAGKTGTAQTGEDRSPHAWFAGYFPSDRPKYAIVVALEHSGSGGEMAGPLARRLIQRMVERGLLW